MHIGINNPITIAKILHLPEISILCDFCIYNPFPEYSFGCHLNLCLWDRNPFAQINVPCSLLEAEPPIGQQLNEGVNGGMNEYII